MADIQTLINNGAIAYYSYQESIMTKEEATVLVADMMAFTVILVAARPRSIDQHLLRHPYPVEDEGNQGNHYQETVQA